MTLTNCFKSIVFMAAFSCGLAYAHNKEESRCDTRLAPGSLNGFTINYQILASQSDAADAPYKGVIVSKYQQLRFSAQGFATLNSNEDPSREYSEGSFSYSAISCSKARETAYVQVPHAARRVTQLTFTSKNTGTWEQTIDNGDTVLSGKFSLIKTDAQPLAPVTNAGFYQALIIKSTVSDLAPQSYPRAGLVVQSYNADGTMTFKGFGPGTLDSTGTYSFKRVSANTAVEEAVQTSAFFTFPYTMVYTYLTPNSGTWEQNFANGLIKFSGTFDTFAAQ